MRVFAEEREATSSPGRDQDGSAPGLAQRVNHLEGGAGPDLFRLEPGRTIVRNFDFDEGDRLALADPALLDAAGLPDLSLLQLRSQGQHLAISAIDGTGADLSVRLQHVSGLELRDLFDVPDTPLSPYSVAPGAEVRSDIGREGDEDWFRVELEEGRRYEISLRPDEAASEPLLDPYLRIYDETGVFLTSNDDYFGLWSFIFLAPGEAQTLFLGAAGYGYNTGDYLLEVREIIDLIPGDTSTEAVIEPGEPVRGRIDYPATWEEPGDSDWYRAELAAGTQYRIDLLPDHADGQPIYDWSLGLYDEMGNAIENLDPSYSWPAVVFFQPDEDGLFFVEAASGGYYEGAGDYILRIQEVVDLIPGDPSTSERLEIGESVRGEVEFAGDVDWFRVGLSAGMTYEFILEPDWTSGYGLHGAPALYDAEGAPLEGTELSWDWPPRIFYTSEIDQEVLVEAGSEYGDFGGYILSARTVVDLVPGDASTEAVLELGGEFRSRLDHPTDADWMRLDVEAGTTYRVDIFPDSDAPDPAYDAQLAIYREDGSRIATFGPHFVAEETGTLFVAVEASYSTGSYIVTARAVVNTDSVPGDVSTPVTLPLDGEIAGRIDLEGDQDWFRVELEEGITVRFDLLPDPSSSQPAWYSELSLRDAEGEPVAFGAGWSGVQRLYMTPEEAGTYYAAVAGGDWDQGDYLLRATVVPSVEDVPGDATMTAAVAPGQTIQSRIDEYYDEDWFMVEAKTGTLLRATVTGDDTWSAPLSYAGISWYGADGEPIGWGQSLFVPQDGPIFVSVSPSGEVGDYLLSLETLLDIAADPSTTATLAVGGEERSTIDFTGDRDWFAVELEGGRTYQFDLVPDYDAPDPLFDPYLFLYDASGGYIGENDDSGGELHSQLFYWPEEDEFVFAAAAGYDSNTGAYIISAREVDGSTMPPPDALPPPSPEPWSHDLLPPPELDWLT